MAEVADNVPPVAEQAVKDAKQLKKEKKEQERLQKEREKQEKKLEKERKKKEETERKKREKEEKEAKKKAAKTGEALVNGGGAEDQVGGGNGLASAAAPPQSPIGASAAPTETAATGDQRPVPSSSSNSSSPEKVTVAEPPGNITGYGQPIGIVFDPSNAGEGPMTATCTGTKIGAIPVSVSAVSMSGMYKVEFTPEVADMYTLSVQWGGKEIGGSPFTINLSRLPGSPSQRKKDAEGGEEREKMKNVNGEEEVTGEISDDPFEMAFQASRLLEQQRQQAAASFSSDSSSNSASQQPPHHSLPPPSSQPNGVPLPSQPLPNPEGFPATREDVAHLEEFNRKLQETNEGLGQEVENLKKKMGEFEQKLSSIEETSRAAEKEREELMANISLRGWLYKRGIKGPTANVWRHRYFRCDQGNRIYYYKAADDPTPKGYIDLEKVESVEEVENDDPDSSPDKFCFNVKCADRTFQLQTDTEDTRKQWITSIEYLKNWHQKNKSTLRSLATSHQE